MKLVDAKKVRQIILDYGREAIDNRKMKLDAVDDIIAIERLIYEMEGEDAEHVARGEWIPINGNADEYGIECSSCGSCYIRHYRYCPDCGARMDAGSNT